MKKTGAFLFSVFITLTVYGNCFGEVAADTSLVNKLDNEAYKLRRTDVDQTIAKATQALEIARKLKYPNGIAESYRVLGVGKDYNGEADEAITNYLNALSWFKVAGNLSGQAKVYNNIGNLYRDNNYDEALKYFRKAFLLASQLSDKEMIASIELNMGNVYTRKKDYYSALEYYNKSQDLFTQLHNQEYMASGAQNIGVAYFNLGQYDKAEQLLLASNKEAKASSRYQQIGSIDLTLASLYIAKKDYQKAQQFLEEGISYAEMIKSEKLQTDFKYTAYQLELKKKNFEKALYYLQDIYRKDSTDFSNYVSQRIALLQNKYAQEEKVHHIQLAVAEQKNERIFFWAAVAVSVLLFVLIILLLNNVRRKAVTNKRLTDLNNEVSRQKDNLDRVNHHLEEIIDERTKDLQIKNRKLADYSSYLSHQIRGPIATLKGLINLEKEGLVNKEECFNMMDKCVSEIDSKIMDMSDMLHDQDRTGI